MMYFIIQNDDSIFNDGKECEDLVKLLSKSPFKYAHSYIFSTLEGLSDIDFENDDIDKDMTIPVGTLEFVRKFFNILGYDDVLHPIEIPFFLQGADFTKRDYHICTYEDLPKFGEVFLKDVSVLKQFGAIPTSGDRAQGVVKEMSKVLNPDGGYIESFNYAAHRYSVSEIVDIISEYRVFVYRDEVVGVYYYNGDVLTFPDSDVIKEMIEQIIYMRTYKRILLPQSYTLDVGVSDRGTFLLEMHNFVSCGTYGFQGSESLIQMYIDGIRFEKDVIKENPNMYLYDAKTIRRYCDEEKD